MTVKIKFTDRVSAPFYLTFARSTTIKDIKLEISRKLNKDVDSFVLRRGLEVLNDKLNLDVYEFGSSGLIEISYT